MSNNKPSFLDKCFKNKDGINTLGQKPNLPIIIWLICVVLSQITSGNLYRTIDLIGYGALFTWAWLEIFYGVNYFRRILGFSVLVFSIYSRLY